MRDTQHEPDERAMIASIRGALAEDIGSGDITSRSILPPSHRLRAAFVVKADGVIAGLAVARRVFAMVDKRIVFSAIVGDGTRVHKGMTVARVSGSSRSILTAERVALNYLQRMSGIATKTRGYADALKGTAAVILDTRKTAPGLRLFDKWAVRLGGGSNHRFGLFDMILIKDNHIAAAGSITAAVNKARKANHNRLPMEVEVTTLSELREAIGLKPDRILLDNMSVPLMRRAVRLTAGRVPLEASGSVTLTSLRRIAKTGVHYISAGGLTHSVSALDISLEVLTKRRKP